MERNFIDCDDSVNPAFMRRAIELAKKGEGRTNPNPLVGAVIVKDGRIIGEGYHHSYGNLHAEREALKDCMERGENPENAVIYVTLEPCCHFGKQPPCTYAIRDAKISCVVVGSRDPNPLVHGKGNAFLREQGIRVIEDFLKGECDSLNPIFFHYITHSLPYVAVKFAMTLDGKIATKTGASKWITNEESRKYVHALRNKYYGIMAGIGTVLKDNPMLTCRLENDSGELVGRNPVRVICDSSLRIPVESNIVKSAGDVRTIIACADREREMESENAFRQKKKILVDSGIEVIGIKEKDGHIDLNQLMKILGEKKIDSLLIEGGGEINFSALKAGIVSKIYAFLAPKIFGGQGKSPVAGEGVEKVEEAFHFNLKNTVNFGEDILLEYERTL